MWRDSLAPKLGGWAGCDAMGGAGSTRRHPGALVPRMSIFPQVVLDSKTTKGMNARLRSAGMLRLLRLEQAVPRGSCRRLETVIRR